MKKILAIGNSFTEDATHYLPALAELSGAQVRICALYIGGCRLSLHHENMLSEAKVYKPLRDTRLSGLVSIKDAIEADQWDTVTFQQQSSASAIYATFQPYLNDLSAYAKEKLPNAKQYMHQTWAYQSASKKIEDAGYETYEEMFAPIRASYEQAAKDINANGIIRSGEAMLALKNNGYPYIHRDCFHANMGVSRLMLACLWYQTLIAPLDENAVMKIKTDVRVSEEQRKMIIDIVNSIA